MIFNISKREINCINSKLIGDNHDYIAVFNFDEEWRLKTKTARFQNLHGQYVDRLLSNDSCIFPVEILKEGWIEVGVFTAEMTTTACRVYITESIKETEGSPLPPSEEIYEEILEKLDDKQNKLTAGTNITIENDVISATGGAGAWGSITGDIDDQEDLKAKLDGKVSSTGAGVSSALYQLDFNSEEVTDETQIVIQDDATKWVRRKMSVISDYLKGKMAGTYVSVNPQSFNHDQRVQARANIKAAAGGNRTLAQTAEQGFVDIRGYTSVTNAFTTPCDGYLQIRRAGTSGTAYLHVDNYTLCSSTNGQTATIFCAQGMKVWVDNEPSGASFIPWLVKED